MKKIGIIGAGASGLFAGINIKTEENSVTILEKNPSIGQKILMTGNGRCNITNASYYDEFLKNIATNKKFMYSSFASFDNYATMDFFENRDLSLVIEENDRVFPASQRASDVNKFFERELIEKNIKLVTEAEVLDVSKNQNGFKVKTSNADFDFDILVIATGGLSYPNTGSTGDGYNFAKIFGHKVTKTYPSLVPIFFKDQDLADVKALSFDYLNVKITADGKMYETYGPALLTNTFLSGPAILNLSSRLVGKEVSRISIELIDMDESDLDKDLIDLFKEHPNKDIRNTIDKLIPQALVATILKRSAISPDKKTNQITKAERISLRDNMKNLELCFDKFGGFNTAIITKGGVDVKEINPKTMESKLIDGLYFIGEVLDVDALTGGYNLQIAFTTAFSAARDIKEKI